MNDVELSVTHLQSQYQRQKKERFASIPPTSERLGVYLCNQLANAARAASASHSGKP
jgi:hypothetical protein